MTRFFWLGFALIASLALATNDPVSAKPNGGNTSVHHRGSDRIGSHRSSDHDRYHNHDYRGWSRYGWFPQYRCYGYYCSDSSSWFYWYGPYNRYLPVSRISELPPTGTPPLIPPAGVIQNVQIQLPSAGPAPVAPVGPPAPPPTTQNVQIKQ